MAGKRKSPRGSPQHTLRKLRWMLGKQRGLLRELEFHNGGLSPAGVPIDTGSTRVLVAAIEAAIADVVQNGRLGAACNARLQQAATASVKFGGSCVICSAAAEGDELDDDGVCRRCLQGFS